MSIMHSFSTAARVRVYKIKCWANVDEKVYFGALYSGLLQEQTKKPAV